MFKKFHFWPTSDCMTFITINLLFCSTRSIFSKKNCWVNFFSANNGKDVQVSRIFSSVPQKMRKKMFSVHIVKKIESRKVIVLEMIFFFQKRKFFFGPQKSKFQDFSHSKTFFFRKKMHLFFLKRKLQIRNAKNFSSSIHEISFECKVLFKKLWFELGQLFLDKFGLVVITFVKQMN